MVFMMAGCGTSGTCADQVQVCIVSDMVDHCRYTSAVCCASAWSCSQGTLQTAPGPCAADDTLTEACR